MVSTRKARIHYHFRNSRIDHTLIVIQSRKGEIGFSEKGVSHMVASVGWGGADFKQRNSGEPQFTDAGTPCCVLKEGREKAAVSKE